jgi:carboxymethylenebutenolidase
MHERSIDIGTADGAMETFITHPETGGPFAAVIVYMDIWGVREELYDIARRIASVGYCGIVPDLYYREGKKRFDTMGPDGKSLSVHLLDAAVRDEAVAVSRRLTDAMAIRDTSAIIQFLSGEAQISTAAMGGVGYCMGGRQVVAVAGHIRGFRATMSLHGTNLVTDGEDSPHLLAPKIAGEIYCGFGSKDSFAPPELIAAMEAAFVGAEAQYRYRVHADADHGYALPDRDIHHKQAANRDWEVFFPMLRRQIGS